MPNTPVNNLTIETCVVPEETTNNISILLKDFVDDNKLKYSNSIQKSPDVYQEFVNWIVKHDHDLYISHHKMSRELHNEFGVLSKNHRFVNGTDKALVFPNFEPCTLYKFLFHILEANNDMKSVIETKSSSMLNKYIDFLRLTLKVKEEQINCINKTSFGLEMGKLLSNTSSGVKKDRNAEGVYYKLNIQILKTFLVSKGLRLSCIDHV